MDHMALPPMPVRGSVRADGLLGLPMNTIAPDWCAFDQELIDSMLFPTHPVTAVSTPPSSNQMYAMPRTDYDFAAENPASVSPSGTIIGARPADDGSVSPMPLDSVTGKRPAPLDSAAVAPQKKKRQRRYTADTRAKHREVQRRFITRKKERLDQEKQFAVVLEKQVQLLQAHAETSDLERERSTLLQQCVANGIDLDGQDMTVFLEEEMEALSQYYTPMQASEASAIIQQTLRYVDGFCPDEAFLNDGNHVAGWKQQSRVEQKTISFRIGKEFPESSATEVFEKTGFAMATVECFSNFFGSGVVIKTKLLQVIDMNTVILYRAIYHPATKEISRFVELLSRVQRGDKYLILMQSLEGLSIQTYVGTQESWVRGVVWGEIKPMQENGVGCSIQWTGCVGECPVESLQQWDRDLVFVVLRYESIVVKPFVTLAAEDAPAEKAITSSSASEVAAPEEQTEDQSAEATSSGDDSLCTAGSEEDDETASGSDTGSV